MELEPRNRAGNGGPGFQTQIHRRRGGGGPTGHLPIWFSAGMGGL